MENDPGKPQQFVCWDRNGHGMVNFKWGVAVFLQYLLA